ncbi:MAG: hypothetical protein IRZ28_13780 [Steroidobacteraceae bacterium]|nr:hypothetical protein [Steroidobacteraceae bacterium]
MLRRTGLALGCFLLCALATAGERRYLQLSTPQLTLVSAASEADTRQIALDIESFRAAFEQIFGVTLSRSLPTRIYALTREDWERYAQPREGVAGYFLAHPFSCDLMFDAEDKTSGARELVLHEYTHYLLRSLWAGNVPAYLDEGLAEALSSAEIRAGALHVPLRRDFVQYLRKHEWMPFDRLLAVRRTDAEYLDHSLAETFYAQSWATVYYALSARPAFGRRLTAYQHELEAGAPQRHAAERLLEARVGGEPNQLIAQFIRKEQRLPVTRVAVRTVSEAASTSIATLDHDESTLALAELMLRFNDRHQRALELLQQLRRGCPDDPRVCVSTAWVHLQAGEASEAARLFDSAARASLAEVDGQSRRLESRTAVALGRGLFQVAADVTGRFNAPGPIQRERLHAARALFAGALDDASTHLEAVHGYVLTHLALEERNDSLIQLTEEAYRMAPNNPELAVALALLHELEGRKDIARTYWQVAARSVHAGPMRARILSRLEADR